MNNEASIRSTDHRKGLLVDCAIVSAALLATFVVVGLIASASHGADGWIAAAVAGGVCWAGGVLAIAVNRLVKLENQVNQALLGSLSGMAFRMGLPLVFGVIMLSRGGAIVEAGVVWMILVFSMVNLIVETPLLLRQVRELPATGKVS